METKETQATQVTEQGEESLSLPKEKSLPKRIKLMTTGRVISVEKCSPIQ